VNRAQFERLLPWLAIGAGAVVIYKAFQGIAAVGSVLTSTGSAIGSGLYDFLHPNEMGETTFFLVIFPDGVRHAVPSKSISPNGVFRNANLSLTYAGDGLTYQIVRKKDEPNKLYAVRP